MALMDFVLGVVWFILPAYLANMSAVFGGKIFHKYNAPFSIKYLGSGKTYLGFLTAISVGIVVAYIQSFFTISGFVQQTILLGFLLALGAMLGDLGGSFIKRKLGLQRGVPAPVLDQLDFVAGAVFLGSFIYFPGWLAVLVLTILTPAVHLTANLMGYKIGLKKEWW